MTPPWLAGSWADIGALGGLFAQLSLISVGGVNTVLPELQRQVVQVHRWMSGAEFVALYALAQAAPGPNMLVSTLIGWRVAGLAGALTATAALVGPPALLSYATGHAWQYFRDRPWRRRVQAGLTPVTAGLVMAAAVLLSMTTATGPASAALTLAITALLLTTRIHPLWLLAAGGLLGMAGLV
ncbi:MAG: chromate transporter [Rhodospirillales bacterium 70-18]|nr:chromate transporter [Rhodospirillales bacterium]OJY64216.1 MAG: chromate transporter [Rhodospirillales bacterium 70-18]